MADDKDELVRRVDHWFAMYEATQRALDVAEAERARLAGAIRTLYTETHPWLLDEAIDEAIGSYLALAPLPDTRMTRETNGPDTREEGTEQ